MKKATLYILISIFVIGFASISISMKKEERYQGLSEKSKIMYQFLDREAKTLGNKYNMNFCGAGGANGDKIWLMRIAFQKSDSQLTEKKGRELIVNSLNDFLEAVNRDENLKPYLEVYPFAPKNIDLVIYNYQENGQRVNDPFITIVSNDEGEIGFFTKVEGKPYGYKSEKYETYDEAVAILQKENETSGDK